MKPARLFPVLLLAGCFSSGALPAHWPHAVRVESAHFRLETDLSPEDAAALLHLAEGVWEDYTRRFGREADAPARVLIFKDFLDYGRYYGLDLPSRRELEEERRRREEEGWLIFPEEMSGEMPLGHFRPTILWSTPVIALPDTDVKGRVFRHELSHLFLWAVEADPAPWFDEGLAEYLATWGRPEEQQELLALVRAFLRTDRAVTLAELVEMDRDEFYDAGTPAYAVAWLLTWYLIEVEGALGPSRTTDHRSIGRHAAARLTLDDILNPRPGSERVSDPRLR